MIQPSAATDLITEMSPGPSGLLFDRDYRIPVIRLESPTLGYGSGDYVRWLTIDGRRRYYEVHVPLGYAAGVKIPVVLTLHGGGGYPSQIRFNAQMDEVADRHGFMVIYPAGTGRYADRLLYWNTGPVRKNGALRNVDDVDFISSVLNDAATFFTIDAQRVYATGLSNGGQMAFRLAAQLATRIAAIAPVSGDRTIGQFWGPPPRPFPVIAFHGKQDSYLAYNGGGTPPNSDFEVVNRIPVMDTIKGWVRQAQADPDHPEITTLGKATKYHFQPTRQGGEDVDFWVLEDGGHTWPGGRTTQIEDWAHVGPINHDISASEVMWAFFQRHTLEH